MGFNKSLSLLLALALASVVLSKDMCDVSNVDRLTSGANKVYKAILDGANGLVEPLEPIRVGKIEGEIPGLKYAILNGTMTEMKNCKILKSECNKQESSFEFKLHCPLLILYLSYEFKGFLGPISVDGMAEEKLTIDDYTITFKGKYALFVSEKDKKRRGSIQKYDIDTELKGKFVFKNTKLIRGDNKKMEEAYDYLNENTQTIAKHYQSPIISTFMKPVVEKINVYSKEFPLEDIINQELF